jgi:DUF4097 and DUF4098 domain-containing protein YvlB
MMHTHLRFALVTAALAATAVRPAPAAAQSRDQRIRVDASVSVDVSREIRAALQDVSASIRSVVRDVTRDVTREVTRGLRDLPDIRINARFEGFDGFGDLAAAAIADAMWDQDQSNWGPSIDDRQTKTVNIGATGTLELENFTGDITVTASSGREVSIDVIREARGRSQADARLGLERVVPEISVTGTRATVRARYLDRPANYNVSTDFVVRAPAGTRIVINSLRADVKVTGIRGAISVTTASGDVVLTDVGAIESAKTANGDVVVRGATSEQALEAGSLNGDVLLSDIKARRISANTVSGSIEARNVECESASLTTISGDVTYAGHVARSGRYELSTNSGDVHFRPSGGSGYALEASTFSGDIGGVPSSSTAAPRAMQGNSRNRNTRTRTVRTQIGDGSATVTLQSFSGDITVKK